MRLKVVIYFSLLATGTIAQIQIDTLSNGIIVENNFPKRQELSSKNENSTQVITNGIQQLTPFAPKSNYETIGIRGRILPWLFGNAGGFNYLLGVEFGFLRNHSVSIDGMHYGTQDHHDNYYGENDPRNRESDDYNGSDNALYFSYNYYYNLKNIREELGISFYTGINYRLGNANYNWDRGISNDSLLNSSRHYYSLGPQLGVIIKWGERKNFALNINIAGLYSTKDISDQKTTNLTLTNSSYHLNSYDLKVGVNLYWWFIRKQRKRN